jgi:CRISPR-associated protein Cas1
MATVLLVEPGVSVTHAAIKMCADQGTLLVWVGEAGVRVYSAGQPGGAAGERILQQAKLRLNERSRIAVARRFYCRMFGDEPPPANEIEKLRGLEGSRVKKWYVDIASSHGVEWLGREHSPKALRDALGYATATLYGVSEAVILAAGYSPSIGFIHTGDVRSLVFDLADTVKFATVVPAAFEVFSSGCADVRSAVRRRCRDLFRDQRTIDVLFENLLYAMGES